MAELYLNDPTKQLSISAGYRRVASIDYSDGQSVDVALTSQGSSVVDQRVIRGGAGQSVIFGGNVGSLLRGGEGVSLAESRITATETQTTFTGPFDPIDYITMGDKVLDFTLGSISGAEGSTGLNLTLSGFSSESEAFGKPTANAGTDQNAQSGDVVYLDGRGSADTGSGSIISWEWTQILGENVQIQNRNNSLASFSAPEFTYSQNLTFELTVTDEDGLQDSDSVTVTVLPAGSGQSGLDYRHGVYVVEVPTRQKFN